MTGQDGASLPQLAAISSPDVKTGRTTGQQLLPIDESVVFGVTEQTQMPVTLFDHLAHTYLMSKYFLEYFLQCLSDEMYAKTVCILCY